MKKSIAILVIVFLIAACKKESKPECETWWVSYWQGHANHVTVTTNYLPYDKDEQFCGHAKDTLVKDKTIVLKKAGADLYDYKTFRAKR